MSLRRSSPQAHKPGGEKSDVLKQVHDQDVMPHTQEAGMTDKAPNTAPDTRLMFTVSPHPLLPVPLLWPK